MEKYYTEGNDIYAVMHNYIQDMIPGEKVSKSSLIARGMKGSYHPRPGGQHKEGAVELAAGFLLSGFSNPQSREPKKYNILINHEDGTFTKK